MYLSTFQKYDDAHNAQSQFSIPLFLYRSGYAIELYTQATAAQYSDKGALLQRVSTVASTSVRQNTRGLTA